MVFQTPRNSLKIKQSNHSCFFINLNVRYMLIFSLSKKSMSKEIYKLKTWLLHMNVQGKNLWKIIKTAYTASNNRDYKRIFFKYV